MKKLFALVLAMVMIMSICVASASAEELNIAYMPNYASLWSVVTGVKMGYFADEGLTVNLVEFADGPTIISAMESGSIDMGYIGPGAHKLCIAGRAKVFMLDHIGNADAVLARKSAGIETYADLKGKKVGYSSGTSSEMILQYALEEAGLTMDDIEAYEMEVSSLVSAMVSGSIDACAAWSPSTATIIASNPDDIFTLCNNATFSARSVSPASWIVLSNYYGENKDVVLRFTRALYKAMDYASDSANFDQVAQWVADQCGVSFETAVAQTGDASWPSSAEIIAGAQDGTIENYYKVQMDAFITSGAVEKEVPVSDFVMFDNMIEAAK